jgi:hypothetical protein
MTQEVLTLGVLSLVFTVALLELRQLFVRGRSRRGVFILRPGREDGGPRTDDPSDDWPPVICVGDETTDAGEDSECERSVEHTQARETIFRTLP